MKTLLFLAAALFVVPGDSLQADEDGQGEWVSMFDGETLAGWKANEMPEKWTIVDGAIKTAPGRSHLFYVDRDYTDFEFKCMIKTTQGSNSGVYFHTKWQDEGWPEHGYESQVNQTHTDPVKSGSLYSVVKLYDSPAKDGQWYEHRVVVRGKNIRIHIDGKLVIDYTEPAGVSELRRLSRGTIALQAHDPQSVVYYRKLQIRALGK